MAIANFFWHGSSLSLYERCCISSFVHHGFHVRVHTFNKNLNIPNGAVLCDAAIFADIKDVEKLKQGGKTGCLAAFSDLFRYKLLSSEPGWWFDTDVFCLKSASDFDGLAEASKDVLVGYQSENVINGAVLLIKKKNVANEILEIAESKGNDFAWGEIGPSLLTKFISDNQNISSVLSPKHFYPIPFEMMEKTDVMFDEKGHSICKKMTSDAYCIHLWNEAINRKNIPKELFPPSNSYLYELFNATGEKTSQNASVSLATIKSLSFVFGIKKSELQVLLGYRYIRGVFLQIRDNYLKKLFVKKM
ncbi:hypothetical protein [Aeromonas fluvialis]|uniref:hypothetical protein n=1 Tax=Aeromonas fluvialis TaxID=591962 RepID=UPI0009FBE8EE|nr:hypothetical protein [Aeromonas fluvialis]